MREVETAGFTFSQCHGHSGNDVAIQSLGIRSGTEHCDCYTLEISLIVTVTFLIVTRYKHSIFTATDIVFAYGQNNETSQVRYS